MADDDSQDSTSSDSTDTSSSSDDSQDSGVTPSAPDLSKLPLSIEVVQAALVNAFRAKGIDVDDDGVKVTNETGLYHLCVRMAEDGTPLPKIPDDTSNLAPGSLKGAKLLALGAIQFAGEATRATIRIVETETSAILDSGLGDADGASEESVGEAAEEALSNIRTLCG